MSDPEEVPPLRLIKRIKRRNGKKKDRIENHLTKIRKVLSEG